jgi:hypothetical protein
MRKQWLRYAALLAALGLFGCKARNSGQPDTTETSPEATAGLGDHIDISLQDWLQQPRAELAQRVHEKADLAEAQQKAARVDPAILVLLPQLHPPLLVPVLRESAWSEAEQISLPPWLKSGARDADLALHLARHGDVDAALKVAPENPALRQQLEALRTEPNIPFEWSQRVGLQMYLAQLRLAQGETEAATELVLLHRQLLAILPPKAAEGPLGAALLPLGRRALTEAARAWQDPSQGHPGLAKAIDKALEDWGALPSVSLPRLTHEEAGSRLFNTPRQERAILFPRGDAANRALDLLAFPINPEGVDSIVAVVDGQDPDRLAEILILYAPKVSSLYPNLKALAYPLVERGLDKPVVPTKGLATLTFAGGNLDGEAYLTPRNRGFGGLVRFRDPGAKSATKLPRDFGAVHLDRSFEANRVRLDKFLPTDAPAIADTDPEALSRLTKLTTSRLEQADLQRDTEPGLLASLTLVWPAADKDHAIARFLLPFVSAWGSPRLEQVEQDQIGTVLNLVWKDDHTHLTLQLPYGQERPNLVVADSSAGDAKARLANAEKFDRTERAERLKDPSRVEVRLPRWLAFESITLGQDKDKALNVLRSLTPEHYHRFDFKDGLAFLYKDPTPATAVWYARQLVVRFGPDDKVAEIRVRYEEGRAKPGPGNPSLYDYLRFRGGNGEKLSAPWQGLWGDLAPQLAAVLYRWSDDQTAMTYQRDFGGGEVTLLDCPANKPEGIVLPPLEFIHRGVALADGSGGVYLGEARAKVLADFKVTQPRILSDGGVLLPATGTPYAQLVAYFENDQVTRILARHATLRSQGQDPKPEKDPRPVLAVGSDNTSVLGPFLNAQRYQLGVIRRVDPLSERGEQGWAWHDDRTRLRLFTYNLPDGLALMTEWRTWPVPNTWVNPPGAFKPTTPPIAPPSAPPLNPDGPRPPFDPRGGRVPG